MGQVPLQNFVFEMDGLNRTTMNSPDHDHLFSVRKADVFECHSNKEQTRVQQIAGGNGQVIMPCMSTYQGFNLAHFIRTGDKDEVRSIPGKESPI